jgi:hypothetical protein
VIDGLLLFMLGVALGILLMLSLIFFSEPSA